MNQHKQPSYRFYATLLDSFQWYLDSNSDTAFQELIDKLNRVPFESEATIRGKAFNDLVDAINSCDISPNPDDEFTLFATVYIPTKIAIEVANEVKGGISQVRASALLETVSGTVELYGDIDSVLPACTLVDIKTTKKYEFPKYLKAWQHILYCYCMKDKTGNDYSFHYLITDFSELYVESYEYNESKSLSELKSICSGLIDFIEEHRDLITDEKLFANPNTTTPIICHKEGDLIIVQEMKM